MEPRPIELHARDSSRATDRAAFLGPRADAHFASPAPAPSGSEVLELKRLRRALDRHSLHLFAQPIVDLSTTTTVHHELLVRMIDERGELLLPAAFIPTAERFGLIAELDRRVIQRAVEIVADGHPVHVNVSGGTLADPDLSAFVEHAFAITGAEPSRLVFEVTETAVIENIGVAVRFFERVRALGCGVAIDDFGMGFGGLGYLKNFVVDYLKIDREFVADIVTVGASAKVVRSIVELAKSFDLQTVAEGVEDSATLDCLRACGVDYAQGFFFAEPAPVAEVLSRSGALVRRVRA